MSAPAPSRSAALAEPPAPIIAPMRWQQIEQVAALEAASFPVDAWSAGTFWAELALRPRRRYWTLSQAGQVTGYLGIDVVADTADLMTICLDPRLRGTGHASRLLQTAMTDAIGAGASRMILEVRADNASAIGLYRRHGFDSIATRRRYYPDGQDALILQVALGSTEPEARAGMKGSRP